MQLTKIKNTYAQPQQNIRFVVAGLVSVLFFFSFTFVTEAATALGVSSTNVVTSGLIGYWTFDGKNMTNTAAFDLSGSSQTGTLSSMTARGSGVIGKIGQALKFSGAGQYISVSNTTPLQLLGSFSVSVWVNPTLSSGTIIGKHTTSGWNGWTLGFGDTSGSLCSPNVIALSIGVGWTCLTAPASVTVGTWQHIVWTYDGTYRRIYINGTLVSGPTATGSVSAETAPLYIGSTFDTGGVPVGDKFNGKIDDVRLYNRAITTKEVQTLYKAGGGVTQVTASRTGLIGYWPFDYSNVFGTNARDVSVYGNNATLVNGPTIVAGKKGQAMQFDGVNDYATLGTNGQTTNNFSFGAWVKTSATHEIDAESTVTTTGIAGQKYVFAPAHKSTNGGAGLSVGTNGISVYEHGDSYMPPLAVYSGSIDTGWNHIFVVYINKRPYIYLNGTLVRTGLVSPKSLVYSPQFLGSDTLNYGPFSGQIDDARVYNRALSVSEIQTIYNQKEVTTAISLANASGLVGHWSFDGKHMTNSTSTDASGSGNNGTLTNMTTNGSAVIGKIGQGLNFDGVNDYISATNVGNVQSISYWIKSNNQANGGIELNANQYVNDNAIPQGWTNPTVYVDGIARTTSYGSDIVVNGNFSANITGWTTTMGVSTVSWQNAASGNGSTGYHRFSINSNVDWDRYRHETDIISASTSYKVSFWYRTSGITGNMRAYFTSNFSTMANLVSKDIVPSTSWQYVSFIMTSTSASQPVFGFFKYGSIGTGTFDVDAVSIRPVTTHYLITDTNWHHVVITTDTAISASAVKLGKGGLSYLNGSLDDVRFYNRQLSASEIQGLYKLGTR